MCVMCVCAQVKMFVCVGGVYTETELCVCGCIQKQSCVCVLVCTVMDTSVWVFFTGMKMFVHICLHVYLCIQK